jgi:hypothetical protein
MKPVFFERVNTTLVLSNFHQNRPASLRRQTQIGWRRARHPPFQRARRDRKCSDCSNAAEKDRWAEGIVVFFPIRPPTGFLQATILISLRQRFESQTVRGMQGNRAELLCNGGDSSILNRLHWQITMFL